MTAEEHILARLPPGVTLGQTSFSVQFRKCGRRCRCASEDGPRHGPYLYAYLSHLGQRVYFGRVRPGDPLMAVLHELASGDGVCVACAPRSLVNPTYIGPGECAHCHGRALLRLKIAEAPVPHLAELQAWLQRIRESATKVR